MKDSNRSHRLRLRVLMISQRMLPHVAGAELQALGLSGALINLGVDVRIATTRFSSDLRGREIIEGVEVRRLPVLRARLNDSTDSSAAAKASTFASAGSYVARHRRDYDIIHAHCISAASIGAAMGARIARLPVLIKPSLGGADGEISKIVDSPFARLATGLLRGVDRFAVLDPGIAEELARLGVSRDRLVHVPNGLDLARFNPATCEERKQIRARLNLPEGPTALFVGQIVRRKGVDRLLEVWPQVSASIKDAWLIFAGEGELSKAVREQSAEPGSRIIYLGIRRDIPELMRAANVFVMPSRNESFGNVIVEAMACGLPVIAGRTGIAGQLAIDSIAGRLVDPERPYEIAYALSEILGSREQAARLGSGGQELAQRFDYRRVAREYLEIYDGMLKERAG